MIEFAKIGSAVVGDRAYGFDTADRWVCIEAGTPGTWMKLTPRMVALEDFQSAVANLERAFDHSLGARLLTRFVVWLSRWLA